MSTKYIIFIIGLPGSGKSHYIDKLKKKGDFIIDDFVTQEKIIEYYRGKYNDTIILCDPCFCDERRLFNCKIFVEKYFIKCNFSFVYFENNRDQCIINSKKRKNKEVYGYIDYLSRRYFPPVDCIEVYKGE